MQSSNSVLTQIQLASLTCQPMKGQQASAIAEIHAQLELLNGWSLDESCLQPSIYKVFRFPEYFRTMAFVNAVASIAHLEDHHPDIAFGYDRVKVNFNTHDVNGISRNDFICAAKIESMLERWNVLR